MPPRWAPLEEHVIVHSRLDSRHLAANLLGDPSERDVFVYLPPGYEASAYLGYGEPRSTSAKVFPSGSLNHAPRLGPSCAIPSVVLGD